MLGLIPVTELPDPSNGPGSLPGAALSSPATLHQHGSARGWPSGDCLFGGSSGKMELQLAVRL